MKPEVSRQEQAGPSTGRCTRARKGKGLWPAVPRPPSCAGTLELARCHLEDRGPFYTPTGSCQLGPRAPAISICIPVWRHVWVMLCRGLCVGAGGKFLLNRDKS